MEYQRNSTRRIGGYNNTRNNQIRITPEMSPFATTNSCGCGSSHESHENREGGESSRMEGCGCGDTRENRENNENTRWGTCGCGNTRENRENNDNTRWGTCGCGDTRESRENNDNTHWGTCGCGDSRESRENGGSSRSNSCGCGNSSSDMNNDCRNSCLRGNSLAMVYSPCQQFENIYDTTEGLCRGTIFRDLDKPFWGGRR